MDCPHCQKEITVKGCPSCGHAVLPGAKFCHDCGAEITAEAPEPKLLTCESCGHKLLTGGSFCPECGKALPPGPEEPKLLTCESCGHNAGPEDNYCPSCGVSLAPDGEEDQPEDESFDPNRRMACPDGMCIGIIGPDGKCTECGKSHDQASEKEEE